MILLVEPYYPSQYSHYNMFCLGLTRLGVQFKLVKSLDNINPNNYNLIILGYSMCALQLGNYINFFKNNQKTKIIAFVYKLNNYKNSKFDLFRNCKNLTILSQTYRFKEFQDFYKVKLIPTLYPVDNSTYYDYKLNKEFDVGITGALHGANHYCKESFLADEKNIRERILNILEIKGKHLNKFIKCNDLGPKQSRIMNVQDYAKQINKTKIWICTNADHGDITARVSEVLASKTLVFINGQKNYADILIDKVNFISFKNDLSDLIEKINYYIDLNNLLEYNEIVNNGYNLIHEKYTCKKLLKYYIDYSANMVAETQNYGNHSNNYIKTDKFIQGFGNQLFVYFYGKLFAKKHNIEYYHPSISGLNINEHIKKNNNKYSCLEITDKYYEKLNTNIWGNSERNLNFKINYKPQIENYEYFINDIEYLKTILPKINIQNKDGKPSKNDLVYHLRAGDWLLDNNHYLLNGEKLEKLLKTIEYDELYVVTNLTKKDEWTMKDYKEYHEWYKTKGDCGSHYNQQQIVQPNKYEEVLAHFNGVIRVLKNRKAQFVGGSVFDDFNFIRNFNKIIINVSTFSWWAAVLSEAEEIYAPKAWKYHKGKCNKNLPLIPLKTWNAIDLN